MSLPSALIVAEYGTLNGGENSLLAMLPGLGRSCRLTAMVPGQTDFANALHKAGVAVVPFEFTQDGSRKPLPQLRNEFADRVARIQPNLVHCNSLSASRICGPVCRQSGVRSIGYLRDIVKTSRQVVRDINCIDRIVAVSEATRQWHIKQGLDTHRVCVIHNGVDTDLFRPGKSETTIRAEQGIDAESPLVLFVGQIGLRKGLDTWLAAAERIVRQVPKAHFLIVGERHSSKQESIDHEAMLVARSNGSPLAGHVHWLGRRTDVASLMRQATLLMHCARQEPLGRVLLEAMASGLPAVATDVGGTSEILYSDSLKACLVPSDDPAKTADAALRLLLDRQLWQETAVEARQIAVNHFQVSKCVRKLLGLYEELLNDA